MPTTQSYEFILVARDGPVTTITLNRPQVHNALNVKLSAELNQAVRVVRDDRDCRIMILRGAGNTFCAGDDLKEFREWSADDAYWQVRKYQETVQIIEDLTPITIAAVDGVATGGGLELTLVCDFVIATDRSRWGMPEVDWNITPGWGGTSRLVRYVGRRKAKEMNLIGALFSAQRAEYYSLVNRVVPAERLDEEVLVLCEVLLAKDPYTLRRTKFIITQGADLHVSGALAFEVPVRPYGDWDGGLEMFTDREQRRERRARSQGFWQD